MKGMLGRGGGGQHELPDRLPSEQDRKTSLGCLAAVLNIVFAARRRKTAAVATASDKAEEDAAREGGGERDAEESLSPGFSIQGGDDDGCDLANSWSRSARAEERKRREMRRARAFQRELLSVSAELLFLSPEHAAVFLPNLDIKCDDDGAEMELLLRPFVESLSGAEESFRCISLLMLRFLIMSGEEKPVGGGRKEGSAAQGPNSLLEKMTIVGYDARVRHAFKYLAVSVLSFWDRKEHGFMTPDAATARATRKFEALEDGIALRLSLMSKMLQENERQCKSSLSGQKKQSTLRQNTIRGLKIGAAGVAAGTVFAITGGLAAPAIVGGIAALTGVGSTAYVLATILLLPAATTIFGVGGGTLVAGKMSTRTAGLTDFDIQKVASKKGDGPAESDPELSRTVCISGWLRDEHDFERPFGMTPRDLTDHHELMCRYCSVYAPHAIQYCHDITEKWKGKEDELWGMCKESYGRDPGSLLPFDTGPRYDAQLSESEEAAVDELMRALGLPLPERSAEQPKKSEGKLDPPPTVNLLSDVLAPDDDDETKKHQISDLALRSYAAWDFHAEYGNELYVVKWEKELLLELHGTAKEFQKDMVKMVAEQALKRTVMVTLISAIALPAALLSLSNMIDEKWTVITERSEEAGVLLAHTLLNSDAGHRPVSLIGLSFGARVIVNCMKELARHQEIWEQQQEGKGRKSEGLKSRTASLKQNIGSMSTGRKDASTKYSREPASIVEDVVLMGCPASVNVPTWLSCREVVGGRLVNCYSQNDMMLALMYRIKNISRIMSPPVGIRAVDAPGVENYDVSEFVANHGEYTVAVKEILRKLGYGQPANVKANRCGDD